jgi:hypothetical protein
MASSARSAGVVVVIADFGCIPVGELLSTSVVVMSFLRIEKLKLTWSVAELLKNNVPGHSTNITMYYSFLIFRTLEIVTFKTIQWNCGR